jgi:hypothetical protein
MRTRNRKLQVWMSEGELGKLDCNSKAAKMSRSAYVRRLISGYEPKTAPPYEYHQMIRELRSICNNLNQLAHRAHATGTIDTEAYDGIVRQIITRTDELAQAFLPTKRR